MTVTCITPPVLGLCPHTITQEVYIQFVFLLHSAKVASSCLVDVDKTAVCSAREGGKEMVRAVLADNVQYLQMIEKVR